MSNKQIFVLLSSKSAGSTALQSYLYHNFDIKTIQQTEHFENETLYWTKAASILQLNQTPMHRSKVPYSREEAIVSLQKFLNDNGVKARLSNPSKAELFELFYELFERTGDLMVEKSPHHLYNETNLDLIREFADYIKSRATVRLLGLIRNPLDTIYSAWDRWRFNCFDFEQEWKKTYNNLKNLKVNSAEVRAFRYEDLVASAGALDDYLINECDLNKVSVNFQFRADSIGKWKTASGFGHRLSRDTVLLANAFGYDQGLVNSNKTSGVWTLSENLNKLRFGARSLLKKI